MTVSISDWKSMEKKSNKIILTKYKSKLLSILYEKDIPCEIQVHNEKNDDLLGSVHIAKVKNIVRNIDAAFVEVCLPEANNRLLCYYSLKDNKNHIYADDKEHKKLCEGDDIIIQISKSAVKTKSYMASSNISLSGKYIILFTGEGLLRFSANIHDEEWKSDLIESISLPENVSCIIRSNAYGEDKALVRNELLILYDKLAGLLKAARYRTSPCILKASDKSYISLIKKYLSASTVSIVTDIKAIYDDIEAFLKEEYTKHLDKLKFYQDSLIGLDKLYSVEGIINNALSKRVWLKSGAYLVIEHTEALTVIDVNTGKNISGKSFEETIFSTNMEAAKEIAYQLRLRNISGIIIADFIDMKSYKEKKELLDALNFYLKDDSIKARALDFTALNLVEITRQKIKKPLYEQFY